MVEGSFASNRVLGSWVGLTIKVVRHIRFRRAPWDRFQHGPVFGPDSSNQTQRRTSAFFGLWGPDRVEHKAVRALPRCISWGVRFPLVAETGGTVVGQSVVRVSDL